MSRDGDPGCSDTARAKVQLRAHLQLWRHRLTEGQVLEWSRLLGEHVLGFLPWPSLRTALLFVSLRREPQTEGIAAALTRRGVVLAVPSVRGPDLVPRLVGSSDVGLEAALISGPAIDPRAVDLILVPGLAFDRCGRRLGRGGGHYDRFLPKLRSDCLRLGMCFEGQLVAAVPTDPWDQLVDAVATEVGVYPGGERSGKPG